jgi:hypothetical protein
MPVLAAMIELVFSKLMLFLGLLFAKRVALTLAGVTAWAAISTSLYLTMRQFIVPIFNAMFQTAYGSLIGLAFPPIAGNCMFAISSVWAACGLYTYQRVAIRNITSV